MNFANPQASRMMTVAALVAPIVISSTARMMKEEATPKAAGAASEPVAVVEAVRARNPKSEHAAHRAAELATVAAIQTPFEILPIAPEPDPFAAATPDQPAHTPVSVPQFIVKSIFRQGASASNPEKPADAIAMINGKAYRTGEQPVEGWTISEIDCQSRTVRITGPDGQTVELQMSTPGKKQH